MIAMISSLSKVNPKDTGSAYARLPGAVSEVPYGESQSG